MPDQSTPTTPAPAPTPVAKAAPTPVATPTVTQALAHLDEVETRLRTEFAGKAGHNPFFFIANSIEPLRRNLKRDVVDAGDIAKALALPKDHVPKVKTHAVPKVSAEVKK